MEEGRRGRMTLKLRKTKEIERKEMTRSRGGGEGENGLVFLSITISNRLIDEDKIIKKKGGMGKKKEEDRGEKEERKRRKKEGGRRWRRGRGRGGAETESSLLPGVPDSLSNQNLILRKYSKTIITKCQLKKE